MTNELFILAILFFLLYFWARGAHEHSIRKRLIQSGIKAQASVIDVRILWYLRHVPKFIVYSYSMAGIVYTGRNELNGKQYRKLKGLRTVEILYLEDDPSISRVIDVLE